MSLDGEQEEGTMVLEEEGHGSVVDGGAGGEPRAEVHANGVGDHVSEVSSRPADALSSAKVTSMKVSVSRDNDDGECMRDVSKWLLEKKEWFGDKMKPSELLKSKKTILEWQSDKAIEQVCPAPAPNSLTICLFFSSPSLYIYISHPPEFPLFLSVSLPPLSSSSISSSKIPSPLSLTRLSSGIQTTQPC